MPFESILFVIPLGLLPDQSVSPSFTSWSRRSSLSSRPTGTITATIWVSDFPYRDEDDLDATKIFERSVTKAQLAQLMDVGINPASGRYVSVEIGWGSTSGASGTRPMEVPRVLMLAQEDLR